MRKIRYGLIALSMLMITVSSATAQVSIGIGLPNVSIGINLPIYPELVRVPGYPVYYAPNMNANYFFYDGMYWVYENDNWYASTWYNGPWAFVDPAVVPLFILRVPVSYYRLPPVYFSGWMSNAPPRWGQHWGHGWEERRGGWDRWKRGSAPAPAPLPSYQRQYAGDRYPRAEQQHTLHNQSYRYQPRDKVVRQHVQQIKQIAPAPASQHNQQPQRSGEQAKPKQAPAQIPHQQPAASQQKQQPAVPQEQKRQQPAAQQPKPAAQQPHQQPAVQPQQHQQQLQQQKQQQHQAAPQPQPRAQQQPGRAQEHKEQERGAQQEPNRGQGQGQDRDDDRGRGRKN